MSVEISPESLQSAGWIKRESSGFNAAVGPFWERVEGEQITLGIFVEDRHTNMHIGTIHGGVVMTLSDLGLGSAIRPVHGDLCYSCVTASLNVQFLSVARVGDFVTVHPEILRTSKQMLFIRGLLKVGEKTIASAEGIWKVMESTGHSLPKKG